MNRTPEHSEVLLDAAIAGVRDDMPAGPLVRASGQRAWARIVSEAEDSIIPMAPVDVPAPEHIRSCEDFRALFPEYRSGTLSPARRMLVEDHTHECVACRKALHPVSAKLSPASVTEMPRKTWRLIPWAIAAVGLIATASASWYVFDKLLPAPAGSRMTVVAAQGMVYKVADDRLSPVHPGEQFSEVDRLRTAGEATAVVRLSDGSVIEVAPRAELSVSATRRDRTIHLSRGQIIVQAAKQDRGHLYVQSADSRVAVKGTIFSVNRSVKGSRVSVIEGLVEVQYRGREQDLRPGDQLSTDASMGQVPVADEIAWSRNYEQHLALLKQFVDLKDKLQQVRISGLRYGSRLLDAVPEASTAFVSVPNLGPAISQVERIVSDQAAQSPELRSLLEKQFPELQKVTAQLKQLGDFLGEEVVIGFQQSCTEFCGVIVAEVNRPGLREYIQANAPADLKSRIIDNPAAAVPGYMNILLANNRLYMAEQPQFLRAAFAGNSQFARTGLGQTVSEAYRRGTGVLVAVDLETMVAQKRGPGGPFAKLGMEDVRRLVAEQREVNGRSQYSAVLSFQGARRGMASWLASPGAMGGLNYVSPEAQAAASFVVKDPAEMLRDAVTIGQSANSGTIEKLERETGVRVQDLAKALGGEVTLALDGPMIPVPSWKVILEVRDPAMIQRTVQTMVQTAGSKNNVQLITSRSANGGYEIHTVSIPGNPAAQASYTFTEGYVVIASSTALLERTMANRRSNVSLARSAEFRSRLPRDQQAHFSGMIYQNAGDLIRLMGKGVSEAAGNTGSAKNAEQIAESVEPTLLVIYGEQDRIELASQGSALNLLTQALAGNFFSAFPGNRTKRELNAY